MRAMKYFRHILMHHETFFKIFDGSQNISLRSIFVGVEAQTSETRQIVVKIKIKNLMHFDPDARVFALSNCTTYNFVTNFLQ